MIHPVTAGGGVLFKENGRDTEPRVLLIFRKGVWDLPKGKKEEGETIEECARREVAEEVGCPLPQNLGKLYETYHGYEEGGESIGKTTHWFAMQTEADAAFKPEVREGIEKLSWYALDEAIDTVEYENLVQVLEAFRSWYKKGIINK